MAVSELNWIDKDTYDTRQANEQDAYTIPELLDGDTLDALPDGAIIYVWNTDNGYEEDPAI